MQENISADEEQGTMAVAVGVRNKSCRPGTPWRLFCVVGSALVLTLGVVISVVVVTAASGSNDTSNPAVTNQQTTTTSLLLVQQPLRQSLLRFAKTDTKTSALCPASTSSYQDTTFYAEIH